MALRLEKDKVVPYAGDPDEDTLYAGFGEKGEFIGIIESVQDITEAKKCSRN